MPVKYVLEGDLGPLSTMKVPKQLSWEKRKSLICGFQNQLSDFLFNISPLTVPFHLDVSIYHAHGNLTPAQLRQKGISPLEVIFDNKLWVTKHIDALDTILFELLYSNRCLISSLTVKKLYDDHPRIELVITTESEL